MTMHTVTVPAAIVTFLEETTDAAVQAAFRAGKSSRGAIRVTADADTLWAIFDLSGALSGDGSDASKSERDALRRYEKALRALPEPEPRFVARESAAPAVPVVGCAVPVVSSATGQPTGDVCGGDVSGATCARCGAFPPAPVAPAPADVVTGDPVAEARTLVSETLAIADRAEGLAGDAAYWLGEAERAATVDRVAECAESARESAETVGMVAVRGEVKASGLVKEAAAKLRRILAVRKAVAGETGHVGDDVAEGEWDGRHADVVRAEADIREAVGRVEYAAREAWESVEAAEDVPVCRMCGCLTRGGDDSDRLGAHWVACGCRAMMAAVLADAGSVYQDPADVAVGRMLWADDDVTVTAGQLALSGDWDALDAATAADNDAADDDAADAAEWSADVLAERAERAERQAAADAVQAGWDWVWGVTGGEPVEGAPVRVIRADGRPVDVVWSGRGMACWSHCPDECPGMEHSEHCTCERRPVVVVDGPAEPYPWEECAECAASTLGVDGDIMREAAWSSKVHGAAERPGQCVTEPETLAAELDAESVRWADESRAAHSLAEAELDSPVRSDDVAEHFRAEAAEYGVRSVACAVAAWGWRLVASGDVRLTPGRPVVAPATGGEPEPTWPRVREYETAGTIIREGAPRTAVTFLADVSGYLGPVRATHSQVGPGDAGVWTVVIGPAVLVWQGGRFIRAASAVDGRTGQTLRACVDAVRAAIPEPEPETTGGEDDHTELPPPAESDDRSEDAPEPEPEPVRSGPYGRRLVGKAERAAELRAEAAERDAACDAAAAECADLRAWMLDMSDLLGAARSGSFAGLSHDRIREAYGRARDAHAAAESRAMGVASDRDRLLWQAKRLDADAATCAEGVAGARRALARAESGEAPAGRGAWVAADGGAMITFPLGWDEPSPTMDADRAFVGLLADAVAARDEGRALAGKDMPSKATHGRTGGVSKGDASASVRPLFTPWKAPKVPAAGRVLDGTALGAMDGAECAAETEAAPGVWLPMAAVLAAETAAENGWAVVMERHDGGRTVIVRASGTVARGKGTAAGEAVGVWTDGLFVQERSGALVGARWIYGGTLSQVLATVGTACVEPGVIVSAGRPDAWSAPAPAGVSDPGGEDVWEGDGGAVPGVPVPGAAVAVVAPAPAPVSEGDAERGRPVAPGDSLVPWAGPEFGDYRAPGVHAVRVVADPADGYGFTATCDAAGCGMALWYAAKGDARRVTENHTTDVDRFRADPAGWDERGRLLTDGRTHKRAGESVFAADASGVGPCLFVGMGGEPWNGGRTYRLMVGVTRGRVSVEAFEYMRRGTARVGGWALADGEGLAGVLDALRVWDAAGYGTPARLADVVSDPGGEDAWETDGPAGRHGHIELSSPAICDDAADDVQDGEDRPDLEEAWDEWREIGEGSAEWWAAQPYADQLAAVGGHPELVRWLVTPWREGDPVRLVEVCHGPGGMATGRGIVGADGVDAIGFEIDPDTCATARVAGHTMVCADIRTVDPRWACFRDVKRVHFSTPCPTLSPGGKRAGLKPDQIAGMVSLMFDASRLLGGMRVDDVCGFYGGPHDIWGEVSEDHECDEDTDERDCVCSVGHEHCWEGELPPLMTPAEYRAAGLAIDADPHGRTSLMLEVILWPLVLTAMGAPIETVTMEQSANLLKAAPGLCEAIQGELRGLGWDWVSFQIEDAADHGAASHRERTWMIARRTGKPEGAAYDIDRPRYGSWGPDTFDYVDLYQGNDPLPVVTMAEALGVPSDWVMDSRGARGIDPKTGKPKGGGTHRMDVPAICVTAPAYGWRLRPADQPQGSGTRAVTLAELARLVGFQADYPWQYTPARKGAEGVRNKTQQVADVVSPFSGALVEAAVGTPRANWYRKLVAYQVALYRLAQHTAEWDAVEVEKQRPALPPAPVRLALPPARPSTGRAYWEPGERVTLAGRAGRTRHSHIGRGVRVQWDDADELAATWEDPAALWAEGTEPALRRPVVPPYVAPARVIAPPYVAPVVVPPVVIPAPRRSVPAGDSVDLFAALDAELSALASPWESLTG
ncbi:hypothetical protein ACF064_01535 [Streptomyces sp. NPDC015492]|uniref:hypothetical protein n=1 Tax=Streptomyces sp. NPDC015492 TaxID=3364958 RepID=UPI0036FD2602